jgi:hypothetical protein
MFHRSFDLSCVLDTNERTAIENAINGVNEACTDSVDAWLYVSQGLILQDLNRTLDHHDHIPRTVFQAMGPDNHSGLSMSVIIGSLQKIAEDYEGWRIAREHENSRIEGSTNFWNTWKNLRLVPYYQSMSGGGSREGIIPILENFLYLKASRNEGYSSDRDQIEQELMNHLGNDLANKVDILSNSAMIHTSPYCSDLLVTLKKRLNQKKSMEQYNETLVKEAIIQLIAAIDARNVNALRSALNPGWYSVNFHNTEIYKKGSSLLSELS